MSRYVFLNDQLVDSDEAQVSIHDAGLLHGVGLFETMRSYDGRVFRLADHLDRLCGSAEALHIPVAQSPSELAAAVQVLLEANDLRNARLRLTVTRGSAHNVDADEPPPGTLIVTAAPMTPYPPELYRYGMTVVVSPYKQNPDDPIAGHKTTNYFSRLLALREAQERDAGEALWFTTTNRLAEGCISNIFLVHKGRLRTPSLDTPVLPGIVRKVVVELAREHDIECEQGRLVIRDLLDADEVFLTNSIMELMPVCGVEAHKVGDEQPGAMYRKLHDLYREAVDNEE